MPLTNTLATKGYCLALISEMDDETLEEAMKLLEKLIRQKKTAKINALTIDDVAKAMEDTPNANN